jgi:hypothetical protein
VKVFARDRKPGRIRKHTHIERERGKEGEKEINT